MRSLLFGLLLLPLATEVLAQSPTKDGLSKDIGEKIEVQPGGATVPPYSEWKGEQFGAAYVRVQLTDIVDPGGVDNYALIVRDRNGDEEQRLTKQELASASVFWTAPIQGDFIKLEIVGPERPVGLSFVVKKMAYQQTPAVPLSITGNNDLEPVRDYKAFPEIYNRTRPVAKLSFIVGSDPFVCTGFLVSDDLLVTNDHCVNTAEICATTHAIFGFELSETGVLHPGQRYRCAEVLDTDSTLDFALLRLTPDPGQPAPGITWGKLELAATEPGSDQQILMVQHPAGEPKQISRKGCAVTLIPATGFAANTDFGHSCDTKGGSSGSPVLNTEFKVVGLHHLGFSLSGAEWRDQNRAIRIQLLRDRILNR